MKRLNSQFFLGATILCLLYMADIVVFYMYNITNCALTNSLGGIRLIVFLLLVPIFTKYAIQLSTAPFYSLIEQIRSTKGKEHLLPTVSVLIPAWNEEVGIINTIVSVLDTQYKNLEIIVINDGSTDLTHKLVSEFVLDYETTSHSKTVIKYLHIPNGGKATALNHGLQLASGEFVITLDADSMMDKNAITKIIKRFTDKSVAAVAGNVIVGNRKKPIAVMQQLEYLYGFFLKRADSVFNSVYIIGGAAAAYRKHVLIELGGFDQHMITEDIEMSTRILAHGYKTRYAADAVVYTEGPSDWNGLCDQRLRWKFGRMLTFIKHRKLFFSLKKKHNTYLTFILLPIAVYAELTLLLEGFLFILFFGYTIITNDYSPLVFVILFMCSIIVLQIIIDSKAYFHRNLWVLAPVVWIVFCIMDIVEFQALCRSLIRLVKREDITWQKWSRRGL